MAEAASDDADHGPDDVAANGHRPKDSVPPAVQHAPSQELLKQPRHGTRGTAPGPRGCWAVKADGDPCGAVRRTDSDFCNAHSGYGVARDPAGFSAIGREASAKSRQRRAELRATLGVTRLGNPRSVLKALVTAEAVKVAEAALDGALAAELPPDRRSRAALALLDAVDPLTQVSTTIDMPTNAEGVEALSVSQLLSFAEKKGW